MEGLRHLRKKGWMERRRESRRRLTGKGRKRRKRKKRSE